MTVKTRELSDLVREAQTADGNSRYYHTQPGWFEDLGYGYDDPVDALCLEGHSALIQKVPLNLTLEGYGEIKLANTYGLVREPSIHDPHPRVTATVSGRFQPIQQVDVAEMLKPIAQQFPLEMIAAYGQFNDHVVWGFRFGEFTIKPPTGRKGDDGVHWLYVDHVNDGGHGLRGMLLNIRAKCTNVLPHAGRHSKFSVSLPHVGNVSRRLVDWADFITRAKRAALDETEMYQHLANGTLDRETIEDVFGAVYRVARPASLDGLGDEIGPDTPDDVAASVERYLTRVRRAQKSKQAAIIALDTFNERNPQFANTKWAVLQGVTEVETWKTGRLRGYSLLFGDRSLTINKTAEILIGQR
jgi:hypothetical protein